MRLAVALFAVLALTGLAFMPLAQEGNPEMV